jgi:hypothetical protein
MTAHQKKVWSTLMAIAVVLGWLVSMLSGLPTAIANAAEYAPALLRHPNFWFTVVAIGALGLILRWVWQQPEESNDPVVTFLRAAMADLQDKLAKPFGATGIEIDIRRFLTETVPVFLEVRLGIEERRRFEDFVKAAQAKSPTNIQVGYRAAIMYLEHFIECRAKPGTKVQGA